MKKKNVVVKYGSDASIYDVVRKDTDDGYKVVLKFSPLDKQWTKPGKVTASLSCDGNGYTVKLKGQKAIRLDYCQAENLELMLRETRIRDSEGGSFKSPTIIETKWVKTK